MENIPEIEWVADVSHDMRKFSDVPWGCWMCGACTCHHQELLKLPCTKGIKKKENDV